MKTQLQLALVATSLLAVGPANALTIDSFDFPIGGDVAQITNGNGGTISVTTTDVGDRFLGTTRTLSVTNTIGRSTGEINDLTPDALDMSNTTTGDGVITILWDGIDNVDLTENNTVLGFILTLPEAIDNDLTVTFTAGAASVTQTFLSGTTGINLFIPFGNQDFSNVTSLTARFTGPVAWDAVVQLIGTAPIPGTLLLMGVGLLGLARWGKHAGRPG
jgi:hypothetical protein